MLKESSIELLDIGMSDSSRHKTGTSDISFASTSGSFTGCKTVASATTVLFSGSLTAGQ